jgi:predicted metal-dependent hydrolase
MPRYPEPYIEYLIYLHVERDFFECHEVLEEYWKSVPESPLRQAWHGLIQIAVALYHQRRGNLAGAKKMLESAIHNITENDMEQLGLQVDAFSQALAVRLEQLNQTPLTEFEDFNFPIADKDLLLLCQNHPLAANKLWLSRSDLLDTGLIHKHTLRDRSEVIEARQKQYELRQQSRELKG